MILENIIKWAEEHSEKIQEEGHSLNPSQTEIALKVGVSSPENVRILTVKELPLPEDPKLNEAAVQTGYLTEDMHALTFGHSIYMRDH